MARLYLTMSNRIISKHRITPGQQVTIGRHPDNDIFIDHMSISGHHAAVRLVNERLTLTDLGSQNGTFVNDERVTESTLAHQDWITVGKYIFIVDLYESLSMEATENELNANSMSRGESDQTMVMEKDELQSGWINYNYLFFLNGAREDYDLIEQMITIGKNKDAKIKIHGLLSFFAGKPSAKIKKNQHSYVIEHIGGKLKTRVNGITINKPTRLKHQDTIKIGPLQMQYRSFRRPSK